MSADAGPIGRWNGRVTRWLARIAAFVLASLAVITFCDVIARYFFNRPFPFTVEITEIAMGAIIYFGVGLVTHDNDHISVDFVTLRMSERLRMLMSLITNVIAFVFLIFLVWRLWLRAGVLLEKADMTPIMFIPLWPFGYLMAFGSIFFLTGILVQLIESGRQLKNPQSPASTSPSPVKRPYQE